MHNHHVEFQSNSKKIEELGRVKGDPPEIDKGQVIIQVGGGGGGGEIGGPSIFLDGIWGNMGRS